MQTVCIWIIVLSLATALVLAIRAARNPQHRDPNMTTRTERPQSFIPTTPGLPAIDNAAARRDPRTTPMPIFGKVIRPASTDTRPIPPGVIYDHLTQTDHTIPTELHWTRNN